MMLSATQIKFTMRLKHEHGRQQHLPRKRYRESFDRDLYLGSQITMEFVAQCAAAPPHEPFNVLHNGCAGAALFTKWLCLLSCALQTSLFEAARAMRGAS